MVEPRSRLVVMGRVLGPFGVKGWVKIQTYTQRPDSLAQYGAWWVHEGQSWREIELEESERHGEHFVARMRGVVDRDKAARLSGAQIAIRRDAMPEAGEGEIYREDLLGLRVVNLVGEELGRIKEIFENGAHDILRVEWAGGERLLPYISSVVNRIDLDSGEIRVDWGIDW